MKALAVRSGVLFQLNARDARNVHMRIGNGHGTLRAGRGTAALSRREALLLSTTAGIWAALAPQAQAADSAKTAAHEAPGGCSTPRTAAAKTQYGKVRGYVDGGVLTFKGIPYSPNTAGRNRCFQRKRVL